MAMITSGQPAPDFTLPDSDMQKVSLADFNGSKNVVLYFYSKDGTARAINEAIDFTDLWEEFEKLNTVILGVSKDNCMKHAAFRDKHGLAVQLLADIDGEVSECYGVWKALEKNGVPSMGIVPSTFVIDRKGVVRHVFYGVNTPGHAAQVLELVRELEL
jgi:peroxiredoxin Q/BCP